MRILRTSTTLSEYCAKGLSLTVSARIRFWQILKTGVRPPPDGFNWRLRIQLPDVHQGSIVGIAAGDYLWIVTDRGPIGYSGHYLGLKENGQVVVWGIRGLPADLEEFDIHESVQPPDLLGNVVAVDAGAGHSLALQSDGHGVAWGLNHIGQCDVPDIDDAVAVSASGFTSMALRADGTVVAWGRQEIETKGLSRVVAIESGVNRDLFIQSNGQPDPSHSFLLVNVPFRENQSFQVIREYIRNQFGFETTARKSGEELQSARALLQTTIELGMSLTLAEDNILQGLLYGSESLPRTEDILANAASLANSGDISQKIRKNHEERLRRFEERLRTKLMEIERDQSPEIPRLVSHTMSLLRLLQSTRNTTLLPVLEYDRQQSNMTMTLFGIPYMDYQLQQSSDLDEWHDHSSIRNRENQTIKIADDPALFFRVPDQGELR